MLSLLHIENIAVIERSDIEFGRGFHVLTGETGAGKSIVIDAINALLGERITRDVVRSGAEKAYIAGVFDRLPGEVTALLEELELPPEEDGTLLIQRSLTADGKGNCRINGRPATVSTLRQVGRMLVNIHGQHESYLLLNPNLHINYIDKMPYIENLQRIKATKCLLEIMQKGGHGYTLRTCEAIMYDKKMLTNNPEVTKAPFYSSQAISVFNSAKDIDLDFVKTAKDFNYNYKEKLSPVHMLEYCGMRLSEGGKL